MTRRLPPLSWPLVGDDADAAYARTHDPVWAVAAAVPVLGQPLATVRGLTDAVRELSSTGLPALASVADDLTPAALRPTPDRVDVERLARGVGRRRDRRADRSPTQESGGHGRCRRRGCRRSPTPVPSCSTQLAPLADDQPQGGAGRPAAAADARRRTGRAATSSASRTRPRRAARAACSAPSPSSRPTRAASRVDRIGANYQLPELPAEVPGLDPDFVERYERAGRDRAVGERQRQPRLPGGRPTWLAMWQAGTGETLDGALAMDPTVLAAVVRATGPLDVARRSGRSAPSGSSRSCCREQYEHRPTRHRRPQGRPGGPRFGRGVARCSTGRADAAAPARGARRGSGRGHALVASTRPEEQALLRRAGLDGDVSDTALPFAQAVVVNAAGGKLDTYLDASLDYRVTRCTADARDRCGHRRAAQRCAGGGPAAPTSSPAPTEPPYPTVPGQNRTDLRVLATRGARLTAGVAGRPAAAGPGRGGAA